MPEQEARRKAKTRPPKSALRSVHAKQVVLVIGMVALLVTGTVFVYCAWHYPQLYDVCIMQRLYTHDGKVIGRDTQPISPRDFRLLVDERIVPGRYVIWSEETINTLPYIDERPIVLVELLDNFKGGPELSYNFNEKYEKLVFYYWARFVIFSVLTGVSLIVVLICVFLPKHAEEIGERGGESWE